MEAWVLYFWFALRSRNPVFFAASNPGLLLGGLMDDDKTEAYDLLPDSAIPKTFLINNHSALDAKKEVQQLLENRQLRFPLILKPNIGLKGIEVIKAMDQETILEYCSRSKAKEILVQEFIDFEREFSLMFYRLPRSKEYGISSIVEKIYPFIIGDGIRNIKNMIEDFKDPFLNKSIALAHHATQLDWIPAKNQKLNLHEIGNYSQGAKFKDITYQLDQNLLDNVKGFFDQVNGIDFCRIDFKSNSLSDFGTDRFKILEINGAKSEPLHIYDQSVSLIETIGVIYRHWKIMYRQSMEQKALGFEFPSFKEACRSFIKIRQIINA